MITVRDGKGDVVYSGPTIFLPESSDFESFGVVKAPADARPGHRARGGVLPDRASEQIGGHLLNVIGDDREPD